MEARYQYVEKLKEEVQSRLQEITQDEGKYKDLVERLILQVDLDLLRACSE
jgi:hypothetical protein